jgi:hypothetical protein
MQPKTTTQTVFNRTAGIGTPDRCMIEKNREKGRPWSRANEYDIRDEAHINAWAVNAIAAIGKTCRQIAPALEPVAWYIDSSSAPAADELTMSTLLMLNKRQMRKMKELLAPMHTAAIMTLGALTCGFGISSTM